MRVLDGADRLAEALQSAGVRHLFGLPGSHNSALFDAVRKTSISTVLTTSELTATFMAGGYWRAGGGIAAVAAIPGPGFAWTIAGLAEAARDDAGLLLITGDANPRPGRQFDLQCIDQRGMSADVVRGYLRIGSPEEAESVLGEALRLAGAGSPGPVVIELARGLLDADCSAGTPVRRSLPEDEPPAVGDIATAMLAAKRPLLFCGQGALSQAAEVASLARAHNLPVLTTTSARGIIPESDPLSLQLDFGACALSELNRLLGECDFLLMLGCRTSHNGSAGFGMRIPEGCTAHVDVDPAVPGSNYAVRWPIVVSVSRFLAALGAEIGSRKGASDWSAEAIDQQRHALRRSGGRQQPEAQFPGPTARSAQEFFATLQGELSEDDIIVTDTGNHQGLARRYLRIERPHGLLVPSDFQSMGFGLPAAIGAAFAVPGRRVVAIVGDGSTAMVGLELATAVRHRLPLVAIVFSDGQLGQIQSQQVVSEGRESGTQLSPIDFEALAAAVGCNYLCVEDAAKSVMADAPREGVTLVEVPIGAAPGLRPLRWKGRARQMAKQWMPRGLIGMLRRGGR